MMDSVKAITGSGARRHICSIVSHFLMATRPIVIIAVALCPEPL